MANSAKPQRKVAPVGVSPPVPNKSMETAHRALVEMLLDITEEESLSKLIAIGFGSDLEGLASTDTDTHWRALERAKRRAMGQFKDSYMRAWSEVMTIGKVYQCRHAIAAGCPWALAFRMSQIKAGYASYSNFEADRLHHGRQKAHAARSTAERDASWLGKLERAQQAQKAITGRRLSKNSLMALLAKKERVPFDTYRAAIRRAADRARGQSK